MRHFARESDPRGARYRPIARRHPIQHPRDRLDLVQHRQHDIDRRRTSRFIPSSHRLTIARIAAALILGNGPVDTRSSAATGLRCAADRRPAGLVPEHRGASGDPRARKPVFDIALQPQVQASDGGSLAPRRNWPTQAVGQLPWGHIIVLLGKLSDVSARVGTPSAPRWRAGRVEG